MPDPFPDWLEPMAATLTQERFTGAEWLFERKYDGIRLIAYKKGRDVRLYSRNRLLQNDAYPAVVAAIAALPVRQAILDGEATGVWGSAAAIAYHIFDILFRDGRLLTARPLEERRDILKSLAFESPLSACRCCTATRPGTRRAARAGKA